MSAERVTPSRIGIRRSNSILTSWVGFDALDWGSSARMEGWEHERAASQTISQEPRDTIAWEEAHRPLQREDCMLHLTAFRKVDYHRVGHAGSMESRIWGIADGFDVD